MSGPSRVFNDRLLDEQQEAYIYTLTQQGDVFWKENVATINELPMTGNTLNDHRIVDEDGFVRKWNGTSWQLPIVSSAQLSIGDKIFGSTPNRVLYVDNNGNLAINNNFVYEDGVIASQSFETSQNSYTSKIQNGSGVGLGPVTVDGIIDSIVDGNDEVFNAVVDPFFFGATGLLAFNGYNNFVSGAQAALIVSSDGSIFGQSGPTTNIGASDGATYDSFFFAGPSGLSIEHTDGTTFFASVRLSDTQVLVNMPISGTSSVGFRIQELGGSAVLEVTDDGVLIINDGAYQLPNVDGNAGDVLTTDGFGNVTFQPGAGPRGYVGVTTNPDITYLPSDVELRMMQEFWYQIDGELRYYSDIGAELQFVSPTQLNPGEGNSYVWTLDNAGNIQFYEGTPVVTGGLIDIVAPSYPSTEVFLAQLDVYNPGGTFIPGVDNIDGKEYIIRRPISNSKSQQTTADFNQENDYVWLERFEPISIGGTYYAGKFEENGKVRSIQDRIYSVQVQSNNGGNNDIFNNKLLAVREFENFFMVVNYNGSDLFYSVYEYDRENDGPNNVQQRSSGSVATTTTLDGFDFCVTDEGEGVISYNEAAGVTTVIPFRVNTGGNLTLAIGGSIDTANVAPYARVAKIGTGKFALMYRENNAGRDLQVETYTTDGLTITSDLATQTAFNEPAPISDLQLIGLDDSDAAVIYNQNNGNMYVIDATGASIVIGGANNPFGAVSNVAFAWNNSKIVCMRVSDTINGDISYDILTVDIATQVIGSLVGATTLISTLQPMNDTIAICNIQQTNGSGLGSDIAIMYNGNDNEYSIGVAGINTTTEQLNLLFIGQYMVTNNDTDSVKPLGIARIFEDDVRGHTFGGLFATGNGTNKVVGYNQQNIINQGATITDYFIKAIDRNTRDVLVDAASIVVPSSISGNSPYGGKSLYRCYRKGAFIKNISGPAAAPNIYVAGQDGLGFTTTLDESNIVLAKAVNKGYGMIQVTDRYVTPDRIVDMGNADYITQDDIDDVFAERRVADMSTALGTDVSTLDLHGETIAKKDKILVVKKGDGNSQLSGPTMLRISPNTTVNQLYPLVDDGDYIELSFTPFGEWKVEGYRQLGAAQYLINAVINTGEIDGEGRAGVKNVGLRLATPDTISTFINLPEGHKGKLYAIDSNLSIITTDESGSSTGTFVTASDGTTSQDGLIVLQADTSEYIEFEIRDGKCYILNVDAEPTDKQFSFTSHRGGGSTTTVSIGNAEGEGFSIGDYVVFQTELPHDVETDRDISIYIDWAIDEAFAANSGEVQWQLEWALVPTDGSEAIDAPTHSGTLVTGDINIPATAKALVETNNLVIPSANISEGDLLVAKVSRIAIDDGNDPTADPVAFTMHMEYQKKAF